LSSEKQYAELNLITLVPNSTRIGTPFRRPLPLISQLHAGKWQITACLLSLLSFAPGNVMLHCVLRSPRKENKHMQQLSAWHSLYLNARKMQSKQVIKVVHIHEHGEKMLVRRLTFMQSIVTFK